MLMPISLEKTEGIKRNFLEIERGTDGHESDARELWFKGGIDDRKEDKVKE